MKSKAARVVRARRKYLVKRYERVLGQRCVWSGGVLHVVGKVTGKMLPAKMRGGVPITLNKSGEGMAAR